jgi:putative DNA primase/helicase
MSEPLTTTEQVRPEAAAAAPRHQKPLFYEKVAQQLIEQLQAGTAPWQKPWAPGELQRPHNPVSGHVYKGINVVNLLAQGQDDPRWMTYKQAQQAGAQVRPGETGTTVQYWKFEEQRSKRDEQGQPLVDEQGKKVMETVPLERPKAFYATVFNASQIVDCRFSNHAYLILRTY